MDMVKLCDLAPDPTILVLPSELKYDLNWGPGRLKLGEGSAEPTKVEMVASPMNAELMVQYVCFLKDNKYLYKSIHTKHSY
jgi:hypothetical protein